MVSNILLLYFVGFCIVIIQCRDHLHQRPDQHKATPGWQEPGLWRPKWIMDREFYSNPDSKKITNDRIYFKLLNDRTVKFYTTKSRPLFEWFKPRKDSEKRLFESDETPDSKNPSTIAKKMISQRERIDGTWWMKDEAPKPQAIVKIETREGIDQSERMRHDTRCDWGKLDGYSAKFRKGRIYKYKGTKKGDGLPIGAYQAGTFIIRATTHRPLVSKDFLAFQ
eukprot:gene12237-16397_t